MDSGGKGGRVGMKVYRLPHEVDDGHSEMTQCGVCTSSEGKGCNKDALSSMLPSVEDNARLGMGHYLSHLAKLVSMSGHLRTPKEMTRIYSQSLWHKLSPPGFDSGPVDCGKSTPG